VRSARSNIQVRAMPSRSGERCRSPRILNYTKGMQDLRRLAQGGDIARQVPAMRQIIEQCRQVLSAFYGDRLASLVLYGSQARVGGDPESDIDLLVLLEQPFDYFVELRRITDLLYPLQLESPRLISAKPADIAEYEAGAIQLYRNARAEGVAV